MKVTLLQMDIAWNNPEANISRVEKLMEGQTADLFVLPEMWATGFVTKPTGIAEDEEASVALRWMKQTAACRQCAVCGSLAVRVAAGSYRNRHYFVTSSQTISYDKHHLFTPAHEHEGYTAGDSHVIATWGGFRWLLLTCYDLRFPVWARYGMAGEYDGIVYVANWPASRQDAWDVLVRARAIENQCYVVAVNRVGDDRACHYQGGSMVVDPVGRVIGRCNENAEHPLQVELSIDELLRRRSSFKVLDDRD